MTPFRTKDLFKTLVFIIKILQARDTDKKIKEQIRIDIFFLYVMEARNKRWKQMSF